MYQNEKEMEIMTEYSKVAIIILNWNGKEDTIECLESLKHITYTNYEILLVDNGSTDGSLECFRELYSGVEIIENGKNLGFAEGNNVGMRRAMEMGVDYVLLLNNDTVVDKKFLTELVKVSEANDRIGISSPFVYWYDYPNKIQHGGEKVSKYKLASTQLWKKNVETETILSDTAAGPCMLISKMNIEKTGLLPLEFPFMMADIGYSFKSRKNGFKIISVREAKIWHKTSKSVKKVKSVAIKSQIKEGIVCRYSFMNKFPFLLRMLLSIFIYWPIFSMKLYISNQNIKLVMSCWEGVSEGIIQVLRNYRTR